MKKYIPAAIAGLMLALLLTLLLNITSKIGYWPLLSAALFFYLFYTQKSVRLAWRKTFIWLSIGSFLLPVAGIIGTLTSSAVRSGKFEFVFGGLIAGMAITLILALTGAVFGIVFLLTALILFREKPPRNAYK